MCLEIARKDWGCDVMCYKLVVKKCSETKYVVVMVDELGEQILGEFPDLNSALEFFAELAGLPAPAP